MKIESIQYKEGYIYVNGIKTKSKEVNGLDKYLGLEINTFDDLENITEFQVQLAVLNIIPRSFNLLGNKSFPRLLTVVYKSDKGFSEYLVVSLNSKSILKSLWANQKIAAAMEDFQAQSELEVLEKLNDEIEKVQKYLDFEIRIGININYNLELKSGKILSEEEMLSYLLGLIETYNLCYIEKPFKNNLLNIKFLDAVKHMALVVNNSYNGDLNNACILETKSLKEMKNDVEELKKLKINPILKYENSVFVNLSCLFSIFILKHDSSESEFILQRLERIMNEMKQG